MSDESRRAAEGERPVQTKSPLSSTLAQLAELLDVSNHDEPMSITEFKASHTRLLSRIPVAIQQLRHGNDVFVILSEAQIIALAKSTADEHTLAQALSDVPVPSVTLDISGIHAASPGAEQFGLERAAD